MPNSKVMYMQQQQQIMFELKLVQLLVNLVNSESSIFLHLVRVVGKFKY